MSFGSVLRQMRKDKGFKTEEFSKRIGYDRKTLQQWETDSVRPPNGTVLKMLCRGLNASDEECQKLLKAAVDTYRSHFRDRYQEWGIDL